MSSRFYIYKFSVISVKTEITENYENSVTEFLEKVLSPKNLSRQYFYEILF